ncbi:MAG: RluA family pseudouridine synthase [Bacillota bacterium]|nr:RluA family pseudouridine synthase [Bacillota bacterium]
MDNTPVKRHNKWITFTVPVDWEGRTVREVLKGPLLLSNRMINRLTRMRGIRLNGRMPWLDRPVRAGDRLAVAIRPWEEPDLVPEPVPFGLVYEDDDLLVVDKPAGINVHPVRRHERGTLAHGIAYHWQQQGVEARVRPVHRLDRDTSGLLLVAKHAYAHQLLDRALREKRIRRVYLAVVHGRLAEGTGVIDAPIARDPGHPLRRRVDERGEPAVTRYRVLTQTDDASFVEAELETGRTHQIRVHFAHLGHPLFGDRLYGAATEHIARQALHAARLAFTHPLTGAAMAFSSPLPEDLRHLVKTLGLAVPDDVLGVDAPARVPECGTFP